MRPKNCPRTSYKKVRKYEEDLYTAEPRSTLREIYDSMLTGTSLNSPIRRHEPLLPDGDGEDDFDAGTREVVDLVDQQELERDIQTVKDKLQQQQQKQQQEASDKAFEERVSAEVAKRLQAEVTSN